MLVTFAIAVATLVILFAYLIAKGRGYRLKPVVGARLLGFPRSRVAIAAFLFSLVMPILLLLPLLGLNPDSMKQFGAIPAFITGFIGGLLGLVSLIKLKERSLCVWFTMLPFAFIILFFLGELVYPH